MAKDEIVTGLMNALERGEDMQRAMQTLLSAGYTMQEIQEASREMNVGSIQKVEALMPKQQIQPISPPGILPSQPQQASQQPVSAEEKPKKKIDKKIIILGTVFLLLLIILIISWIYIF